MYASFPSITYVSSNITGAVSFCSETCRRIHKLGKMNVYSRVSQWNHFDHDVSSAILLVSTRRRLIVYVSLFVARWFAAIGAFRSSLLFRLLDVVPVSPGKAMQERIKQPDRDIRFAHTQTDSAVSEHASEKGHLSIWKSSLLIVPLTGAHVGSRRLSI